MNDDIKRIEYLAKQEGLAKSEWKAFRRDLKQAVQTAAEKTIMGQSGANLADISKAAGVSRQTVWTWINEA